MLCGIHHRYRVCKRKFDCNVHPQWLQLRNQLCNLYIYDQGRTRTDQYMHQQTMTSATRMGNCRTRVDDGTVLQTGLWRVCHAPMVLRCYILSCDIKMCMSYITSNTIVNQLLSTRGIDIVNQLFINNKIFYIYKNKYIKINMIYT